MNVERKFLPLLMYTVFFALGAASSGGCSATARCYEGPARPLEQVARIESTDDLYFECVDGKWQKRLGPGMSADSRSRIRAIELPPGDHRLAVYYRSAGQFADDSGLLVVRDLSFNLVTLRHTFEAGKRYALAVEVIEAVARSPFDQIDLKQSEGRWTPALIDVETKRVVALQEVGLPTLANPTPDVAAARSGPGATVYGAAWFLDAVKRDRHAAGRDVVLLPKTAENMRWLEKWAQSYTWPSSVTAQARSLAKDAKSRGGRSTVGYATGNFEFNNVSPGEYVVLFACARCLARADVIVGAKQTAIGPVLLEKVPTPLRPGGKK